ncbi:MAG: crossover junction endodeoxyribonuclease RuvC [Acidimicrobiales bacterium]
MFVLGIDPGLSRCGFGVVRSSAGEPAHVASGVISTAPGDAVPERLARLAGALRALMAEHCPDVVAVERVFFQTNVRTAMSVGQASGLALMIAAEAENRPQVVEYTSNEVKKAVAGYGGATKEQVQEMVRRLLHLASVPRPADTADALALAICHLRLARWQDAVGNAVRLADARARRP